MSNIQTDWTREEFKAYLLAYAANADFFETEEEKEIIGEAISKDTYRKIHRELEGDNDYQSIQKILFNIEKFDYSKTDLNALIQDIQNLFLSDGKFDLLESNFLSAFRKLIS